MCKSTKQKLNIKSSTKAEVVGSSDYLPSTMFLAEQGYKLTENICYHDNQSVIQLEKIGRASCGQKSRHINIVTFMQDLFESEGISVVYCPTDETLANFLIKPLQGSFFRKFLAVLLGHCHVKRSQNLRYLHPRSVLRIRYWRKFDLELADRRSRCQSRKKCLNKWRSHLLPRMRQFSKRASSGHQ